VHQFGVCIIVRSETSAINPFSFRVRREFYLRARNLFLTRGCGQADRTEPYTKIEPFQETLDTTVEYARVYLGTIIWAPDNHDSLRFFYRPLTLTALALALGALAYVATTQDVLAEGRDKRRVYVSSNMSIPSLDTKTLPVVHTPQSYHSYYFL
jgi:hypothetical protein